MSAKVLVVDDIEFNLELTARLLKLHDYTVIFASNGEEAIQITEREQPDIILMDIGLPDIDGWQVVERLKGTEATNHIPIIALTAHDTIDHKDKAKATGCSGFITKPIEVDALIAQIKNALHNAIN